MFDLNAIFGGKSWYKSLTAWGLVILGGISPLVGGACAPDVSLLSFETCEYLTTALNWAGQILTVLGIRKAATAPNT